MKKNKLINISQNISQILAYLLFEPMFSEKTTKDYSPRLIKVDLSEAYDTEAEADLFLAALKKEGVYKKNLLFCGFDGSRQFRLTGKMFAVWEEDLRGGESGEDAMNPINYAFGFTRPAIAIIDGDQIDNPPSHEPGWKNAEITVKKPSAILAIAKLISKQH